jgi:hypothetical protein
MPRFKVCYNVKNTDKVLDVRNSYFDTLQEAFKFSKEIYGMRKNGYEVIGRPSIERIGDKQCAI